MKRKKRQDLVPERDATQGELQWIKYYIALSYNYDSKEDRKGVRRPRPIQKSRQPSS